MEKTWKRSFMFNMNMLFKMKNIRGEGITAFKNSLVKFAKQGNVSREKLSSLVELLNQVKTTNELKAMAKEEFDSPVAKAEFESWVDVPVWANRDKSVNLHIFKDSSELTDNESAISEVQNELADWVQVAQEVIKMIKVYTKNSCIQCKMTKRTLSAKDIDFEEINVDNDAEALEYLKSQGIKSLPYVETPDKSWTGFRPDMLKQL